MEAGSFLGLDQTTVLLVSAPVIFAMIALEVLVGA